MYTVVQYRGLQAGNTLVGKLCLIISRHVLKKFQFIFLWPILYLWNAKTERNNRQLGNNYRLIWGE